MNRKRIAQIAAVTFIALASTAMYARAEGTFDRTLTVSGPVELDVSTGSGHIYIKPGSGNQVQVHGIVRASEFGGWLSGGGLSPDEKVKRIQQNPPIEQNGNGIHIGRIEDSELKRNISIDYELTVPAATRVTSNTGSGDQRIQGVQGPVEVRSGSGNLEVSQVGGEVRAATGSGDVTVNGSKGGAHLSTGSGSIRGTQIAGSLDASTGSGDIRLQQTAEGSVRVRTGSGDVELSGVKGGLTVGTGSGDVRVEGEPTAAWRVETGSGGVDLRVAQQVGFDVYARTSSGRISIEAPITQESASNNRREIRGKVRGGGSMLDLHTGSGDITVR